MSPRSRQSLRRKGLNRDCLLLRLLNAVFELMVTGGGIKTSSLEFALELDRPQRMPPDPQCEPHTMGFAFLPSARLRADLASVASSVSVTRTNALLRREPLRRHQRATAAAAHRTCSRRSTAGTVDRKLQLPDRPPFCETEAGNSMELRQTHRSIRQRTNAPVRLRRERSDESHCARSWSCQTGHSRQ